MGWGKFLPLFLGVKMSKIADNNTITGTSTDDYVANNIYTPRDLHKTIFVKNSGGANSITYYVRAYPASGSTAYKTIASGALIAAAQAELFIEDRYYKIVVGIKSTVGSSHSTYSIDYIRG